MRNKTFIALALALVCILTSNAVEVTKVVDHGPDSNRIVFAIVGEGYNAQQQAWFNADTIITTYQRSEPWKTYSSFVNFYQLNFISADSGVDMPAKGIDANTLFGGIYSEVTGFGIDEGAIKDSVNRYLGKWQGVFLIMNTFHMAYDSCASIDGKIAICNRYNGTSQLGDTALHEMGHVFGLADEYILSGSPLFFP